jgi:hypothetical protein
MEKRLIPQNAGRHRNHWKPNGVIAKVIAKHEDMAAARSQILDEIGRLEQNGPAVHELDLARMRRLAENWPAQGWHHEDRIEQYRLALLRGISIGHILRRASGGNA